MTETLQLTLKAARVQNGYTQEQLAERLGVTKRTVSVWESGKGNVPQTVVYAHAYLYGMRAEQLKA